MADFIKAGIRLTKIGARDAKPHYEHLSPDQKKLVKAMEAVTRLEREMGTEEIVSGREWRQSELGRFLLEQYLKATTAVSRYSNKLGIETEEQAAVLLASTRTSRYYGGSF